MKLGPDGRLRPCRFVSSPNHDERPAELAPSLLVVHSISLPPGEYGGDGIERLFTNRLDPAAHPYFAGIAGLRVSSHFLIRRSGELVQFVPTTRRAWHAGESSWRGRARCNDFSIGVDDLRLSTSATASGTPTPGGTEALPEYLDAIERKAILEALGKTGFNRTAAAKLLGITFRQLRYRMQRLGIKEPADEDEPRS